MRAQSTAIQNELVEAFALLANPDVVLSGPLEQIQHNGRYVIEAVAALGRAAKARRLEAQRKIHERSGKGGSPWKRALGLVRSFTADTETQRLRDQARLCGALAMHLVDEATRLDGFDRKLDKLRRDVDEGLLSEVARNDIVDQFAHWTGTGHLRGANADLDDALEQLDAAIDAYESGVRDFRHLTHELSDPDAINKRVTSGVQEYELAQRAERLIERIESDDRFAGLLGGPKERAECLLALDHRSFVELLVTAGQDFKGTDHPTPFPEVNYLRSRDSSRYRHVAPTVDDRLMLCGETLDTMQRILCTGGSSEQLEQTLARAATVMHEAGSAIHLLWDGNGRSLRALFYLINFGFEQPARQGPELRRSIVHRERAYLGTEYALTAGHVSDVAIIDLLRPHAADFSDPAVPRELPSVATFESDPRLGRFSESEADALRWIVRQDDTVASGLGFAAMWTFAKRHGYTARVVAHDAKGGAYVDLVELASMAKADGRFAELVKAEEKARVHLVRVLLRELERPETKVFGKTNSAISEIDATGRGAVIGIDDFGKLGFRFDDESLETLYEGKTPVTISEAVRQRLASATIRETRPQFGDFSNSVATLRPVANVEPATPRLSGRAERTTFPDLVSGR